jgi:hypothetical protein
MPQRSVLIANNIGSSHHCSLEFFSSSNKESTGDTAGGSCQITFLRELSSLHVVAYGPFSLLIIHYKQIKG